MRCRINLEDGYYIGEVYGTWVIPILGFQEYTGWHRVTDRCFTRIGCKLQLKFYAYKHKEEEFDL